MIEKDLHDAFSKVKDDMILLGEELLKLRTDFNLLRNDFVFVKKEIFNIKEKINDLKLVTLQDRISPTHQQTVQHITPTHLSYPTDNQTLPQEIEGLKSSKRTISTGNEGVSTNQQTYSQTVQQTEFGVFKPFNSKSLFPTDSSNISSSIEKAGELLESLDHIKKEIRLKFKRLTSQEMAVFSSIYSLEDKDPENVTYKRIAENLNLSESSIRDYVLRMLSKGIPLKKEKINNKLVILGISRDLKHIATLSTIQKLREL